MFQPNMLLLLLLLLCNTHAKTLTRKHTQTQNPNKARVSNPDTEWTKYISDRHELARALNHESRALQDLKKDPPNNQISIFIKNHKVSSIDPSDITNPYKVTIELLKLMNIWNEATKPAQGRYGHIRRAVSHLIEFARQEDISLDKLQTVYDALCYIFVDRNDASFFYRTLYYVQFPYFISNGRLKFVQTIGSGAQADVIKVREHTDASKVYALKIFNKDKDQKHCQQEEGIMRKIKAGITERINIPRIFGKHCKAQSILMEYVEGDPLDELKWSEHEVAKLLNQVSSIIIRLGQIGIGHFDLNEGNILKNRVSGDYWLIDFGFAISVPFDKSVTEIIGTFLYLAPQSITLNMVLRKMNKREVDVKTLVVEANLYSLQAITLNSLLLSDTERRLELEKYQNKMTDEWHDTGDVLTVGMLRYLCDVWKFNQEGVAWYFKHAKHSILHREMFSKLTGNFRYLTLKSHISTDRFRDSALDTNSRCTILNH